MEAHLLRTLSDNGETLIVEPSVVEGLGLGSWQQFMHQNAANVVDEQLRASSPDSDISKTDSTPDGEMKGDEDEGFDEEFCDSEDPPLRTVPDIPPLSLQELNGSDLQTLLADSSLADSAVPPFPAATLFDDIDPGVYMLEAENSTHSMLDSEPGKSPLHSPFPVSAPSPVCAGMSLTDSAAVTMAVDDWNINSCQPTLTDVHSHYPPASSVGGGSGYSSPVDMCAPAHYLLPPPSPSPSPSPLSSASYNYDLDMLVSMCHQTSDQPPISASPAPQQLRQQGSLCNMTFGDRFLPSSPSLLSTSPVPCAPPLLPSTTHYSTPQTRPATGCSGGSGPNSTPHGTRTDGSMSCTTQTPSSTSSTPDHTPNTLCSTAPLTESSDETDIPKKKPSIGSDRIVNMPFYQFKKILDSPSIPEEKKSDIKNIRRRGKNKLAAKTCRQRKMDLVLGLQQEVEQLRALKLQISDRTNNLQREIEALKTRCLVSQHHRHHNTC